MRLSLFLCFIVPFCVVAQSNNIIGGSQIPIEDAPYIVSLVDWTPSDPNNTNIIPPTFVCGGVLINDSTVLTSAHCILNKKNPSNGLTYILPQDLAVHSGHAERGPAQNGANIQFANFIRSHPNYVQQLNDDGPDDIAIVHLSTPIIRNHQQYPIEFATPCNTQSSDYIIGSTVFLPGWGDTTACSPSGQAPNCNAVDLLRATTMQLIDSITANQVHVNNGFANFKVTSQMLAFIDSTSTANVFDSGSPAVLDKNGNKMVIGTGSWSYKATTGAVVNTPAIYSNVLAYHNFIDSAINAQPPSNTLDLYTKDKPWDDGVEPFSTANAWTSEDIWVRHQNDGVDAHQNPEFSLGANPNYIHVRITNNSCVPSTVNDSVKIYWAKASTALTWPNHWNGSLLVGGQEMGNLIGTVALPVIQPGDAYVAVLPWLPPDPQVFANLYQNNTNIFMANEPHHFCLLSRIISSADTMTIVEGPSVYSNTLKNNNIAWRNISVLNLDPTNLTGSPTVNDRPTGANVIVGGMGEDLNEPFEISFCNQARAGEVQLTEFAEVKITLDDALWLKWEQAEFAAENITVLDANLHQILVENGCGKIMNLEFEGFDQYVVHTSFNFLTDEVDQAYVFHFGVVQSTMEGEVMGGESFELIVPDRASFDADAGEDEAIHSGDSVTLSAQIIHENAIYNWYNEAGVLMYTGENFTVSPDISQQYQLEVIAESDGFKDYDQIEVTVQENYISNYAPNPANQFVDINYEIENTNTAFIMLLNLQTNASSQHILSPHAQSIRLNTNALQSGNYGLILYVNGAAQDAKTLIIQ